ncbi:MAG: PilZ domain-containing protein [Fibromonadaceae bacterium]|jgi:c-di-GMP-binding flagellar brake protein YcgR|nr:PilZ domain-containing protein [Fibromonadaceae bacterium]
MLLNLQKLFLLAQLKPASDSLSAYQQFARSIINRMSNFSIWTIIIFISLIIIFVLLIVIYEIYRSNKTKQDLRDLAWRKFEARADFLKLSQKSIDLLKRIIEECGLQDPSTIIKSAHVFEKTIGIYYEIKKIKSISDSRLASIRDLRRMLGFLPLSKDIPIVSTRQFEVGDKCAVQIPESGPATHKGMCLISDVDERYWSITGLSGSPVPAKTWILVNYVRSGDAEYIFRAQVVSEAKGNILLTHTSKLNRAQQRNWVRIDVSMPVEVTQVIGNGIGDIFSGKIIDMSGGGFGMALPVKLQKNARLLLHFELPGHGTISDLPVKVVRVAGKYNNDPLRTVHSVAFDGDVHLIQEQIIQYVFEKQRQSAQALMK